MDKDIFKNYKTELSMINVNNPDFKNKKRIHDWRNHVEDDWIENWDQLTERERKIICVMAQRLANNEDWD